MISIIPIFLYQMVKFSPNFSGIVLFCLLTLAAREKFWKSWLISRFESRAERLLSRIRIRVTRAKLQQLETLLPSAKFFPWKSMDAIRSVSDLPRANIKTPRQRICIRQLMMFLVFLKKSKSV